MKKNKIFKIKFKKEITRQMSEQGKEFLTNDILFDLRENM